MPIFEYQCDDCGTEFEKLIRRTSDEAELACPKCGEKHLQQMFSTFAAKASGPTAAAPQGGGCPAGMCGSPGMCGRN